MIFENFGISLPASPLVKFSEVDNEVSSKFLETLLFAKTSSWTLSARPEAKMAAK